MIKNLKRILYFSLMVALMSACGMNDSEDANGSMNKTYDSAKDSAQDAVDGVEDSIENVMNYFEGKGVKFENAKEINNMDFAAHEGRSFEYNGNTGYLYRVKSDDENMKKIIQEAKTNRKVNVNINNEEKEYGALVNGNFLFLYDQNADWKDVETAFPAYTYSGVTNPSNPGTTQNGNAQDNNME